MARPKKPPKEVMVDVPLKLLPAHAEIVKRMAIDSERSMSFVSRKLLLRGLAEFMRDGYLEDLPREDRRMEASN